MKKAEVKVGEMYAVKVSGNVAPVVIDEEHPKGGWVGTNQETNRQVRIKNAGRLRCPWDEYLKGGDEEAGQAEKDAATADTGAPGGDTVEASSKETKAKKKRTRAKTGAQERGLSGIDAAAKVLAEAGEPLNCKTIVERALEAGYWASDGKTPHATVYSAILRDMQKKGDESRFQKVGRGLFALAR